MMRAIKVASWHLNESLCYLSEHAPSEAQTKAADLDAYLIDYCQTHGVSSVLANEVLQFGPIRTVDKRNTAVSYLEERNRLRTHKLDGKKAYFINPELLNAN